MSVIFRQQPPTIDEATLLASYGFVRPVSDAFRANVSKQFSSDKLVFSVLDADSGEVVGFASFRNLTPVLYLSGIVLKPECQGLSIAKLAVFEARALTGATHLALYTQSSRMWASGAGMTGQWFPRPGKDMPDDLRPLAEWTAARIGLAFPVAVGQYRGPLYGEKPVHRDAGVQCWWDSMCDFERGDAVFCIGPF